MADRDVRREARAEAAAEKARGKAQRPWYQKKRFILPLGLLLLVIVVSAASGGGEGEVAEAPVADSSQAVVEQPEPQPEPTAEPPAAEPEPAEEPAETVGVGQPASDGQFTFTVNGLECGATTVGENEFLTEEAQGQFCLLNLRVENTGDQAQALFADNQYLLGEDGTQYSASSSATITNDPEGQSFFAEINPGNAVEGTIVFDVPPDTSIARARLHDSAFSGGVEVNLQ